MTTDREREQADRSGDPPASPDVFRERARLGAAPGCPLGPGGPAAPRQRTAAAPTLGPTGERGDAFARLVEVVQGCRRCPAMTGRRRVFGPANGSPTARVLVVAEAPGRLGADRTGVPLSADRTGRNVARLLAASGWRRDELFITNAVLCNPRDAAGRNRPPLPAEVANCRPHLAATLALLDPSLVLTLGARALAALDALQPHGLRLREAVATPHAWAGRWLFPLYHPGPRALIHRPFDVQVDDWRAARRLYLALVG